MVQKLVYFRFIQFVSINLIQSIIFAINRKIKITKYSFSNDSFRIRFFSSHFWTQKMRAMALKRTYYSKCMSPFNTVNVTFSPKSAYRSILKLHFIYSNENIYKIENMLTIWNRLWEILRKMTRLQINVHRVDFLCSN